MRRGRLQAQSTRVCEYVLCRCNSQISSTDLYDLGIKSIENIEHNNVAWSPSQSSAIIDIQCRMYIYILSNAFKGSSPNVFQVVEIILTLSVLNIWVYIVSNGHLYKLWCHKIVFGLFELKRDDFFSVLCLTDTWTCLRTCNVY